MKKVHRQSSREGQFDQSVTVSRVSKSICIFAVLCNASMEKETMKALLAQKERCDIQSVNQ